MPFPSVVKFINWITGAPIAFEDAIAASFGGVPGSSIYITRAIDFNAIGDTTFPVVFPNANTRYCVEVIIISGASRSLTTAEYGLFSAAAGAGTAIRPAATPITVNTASENTVNNMQIDAGPTDTSYTFANLYFRVTKPQGVAATASVSLLLIPVS